MCLNARVTDAPCPRQLHRPEVWTGLATRDDPINALEVDPTDVAQKGLARKEPNGCWHLAQLVDSREVLRGLYRDAEPHVGWPIETVGESASSNCAFGQNLVGVLWSLSDHIENVLDKRHGHPCVEEVAHRIDEDDPWGTPP